VSLKKETTLPKASINHAKKERKRKKEKKKKKKKNPDEANCIEPLSLSVPTCI